MVSRRSPDASEPATTAAGALVSVLQSHGVDRLFCVAGESYLALLDALLDSTIDVVTCRHEGSAGFMAIADAKLTGRPGICLVSRGPGAANAAIAVHGAAQDATPIVLIVGSVRTTDIGRKVFQEMDCAQLFAGIAKRVWVLHDPDRAAEFLTQALHVARSGTPGPTVLVLPQDVQDRPSRGQPARWAQAAPAEPGRALMSRVAGHLAASHRPLLIAGGLTGTASGRALLLRVAQTHAIPVVTSNKRQDLIDNNHGCYAGHLSNSTADVQREHFQRSDLVIAVGTRLDPVTTRGDRFPAGPEPDQPLIHVYPDPGRLGLVYRHTEGSACDPMAFLAALAALRPDPELTAVRQRWARTLHHLVISLAEQGSPPADDGIVFGDVVSTLNQLTGGDVVVALDAGTFTAWVYRHLRLRERGRMLGISSSPMGFGVPAAVAASMRITDVPVVAIVGDGGFGMNGSELATAVARRLPLIVLVADNGSYGTIRQHQERVYPGRVAATDLVNPDFALLARAYGALGLCVRDRQDIEPVLKAALAHAGPALLHIRTSLTVVSPDRRLGQ